MASQNAALDNNGKPSLTAVSSSNGTDIVRLYADPTTHRLLVTTTATTNGSATAQTGVNSNIVQVTVGGSDSTYLIMGALNCTAYTSGNLNYDVTYTDPSGNVTTIHLQGHFTSGYGINVSGTGDFEVQATSLRAKANTTVTLKTSGTFTLTYDVYGSIMQIA